jgi:hypothetical protein
MYKCLCGSPECRGTIVSAKVTMPKKKAAKKAKSKKKVAGKNKRTKAKTKKKAGRGR